MDLVLAESAGVADALEELPAGGVLHDDGEVRRGEDDLLEADDVRVAQRAVVDDLALHVLVNLQGSKKPLKWGAERQASNRASGGSSKRTFSPRSMYLTATSCPSARLRMRRATPKLPEPISRTSS
jgi:hypothetical protein